MENKGHIFFVNIQRNMVNTKLQQHVNTFNVIQHIIKDKSFLIINIKSIT